MNKCGDNGFRQKFAKVPPSSQRCWRFNNIRAKRQAIEGGIQAHGAKCTFGIKESFACWKRIKSKKAGSPGFSHVSWELAKSMKEEMSHDRLDIARLNVRLSRS
jgi:hypothetical protein